MATKSLWEYCQVESESAAALDELQSQLYASEMPPLEAIDLCQPYQSLGADLSEGVASIGRARYDHSMTDNVSSFSQHC